MRLNILCSVLLFALCFSKCNGKEYFVSKSGSDANDCSGRGSLACLSLGRVFDVVMTDKGSNNTILVDSGVYSPNFTKTPDSFILKKDDGSSNSDPFVIKCDADNTPDMLFGIYLKSYVFLESLTVQNCHTVVVTVAGGTILLNNVHILDNNSTSLSIISTTTETGLFIEDSVFENNYVATEGGGAISCNMFANCQIRRTIFRKNSASNGGGAISATGLSTANIEDCVFVGNTALDGGAIIANTKSTVNIIGSLDMHDNNAVREGGGIYVMDSTWNWPENMSLVHIGNNTASASANIKCDDSCVSCDVCSYDGGSCSSGCNCFENDVAGHWGSDSCNQCAASEALGWWAGPNCKSCDTDYYGIECKQKENPNPKPNPPFPLWAIILIACGGVVFIAVVIFVIARYGRRRRYIQLQEQSF